MTDRAATGADEPGRPVERRVARRTLLLGGLLGGVLGAAGCGADRAPRPAPAGSAPPPVTTRLVVPEGAGPPPSPEPVVPVPAPLLPDVPPYALLPGEVEPAAKRAAVDCVTAVLTAGTASVGAVPLADRLRALGQRPEVAAPLLGLLPPEGASALEVVYPQYGGLSPDRREASVMLVADQLVAVAGADPAVVRRSTTVDVRLRRDGAAWTVVELLPAVPPAPAATLTSAVRALLATDRVVLPAAARADLAAGAVHDVVAETLLDLSQRWRLHVQVLVGGHPLTVFATDKVSNHVRGKAVDLWAVDGTPVIDHARCAWEELMAAASAAGASEVGGPVDGGTPGHFTDPVHQDHVHLGWGAALR